MNKVLAFIAFALGAATWYAYPLNPHAAANLAGAALVTFGYWLTKPCITAKTPITKDTTEDAKRSEEIQDVFQSALTTPNDLESGLPPGDHSK